MSEATDPSIRDCEDCLPPAEAFSVLGNETRLTILEALWRSDSRPVGFSDLRRAVGMRDSAQFNYHLGELTDQYVEKTEGGYDLRHAGEKVVRAVIAGSFTQHPRLEPFETESDCTECGARLVASYADEMLSVDCPECGLRHGRYSFPPGGLTDRSDRELLDAFDQRVRHLHCLAADGVCPECSGQMETELVREGTCCLDVGLRAEHVCRQCAHELCSPVGLRLLDQSDVVSFLGRHGVDVSDTPYWELDWCVGDDAVTVLDTDPWRVRVDIAAGDEVLRVTLDGELTVLDAARD
jgi:DNA-binding transcriptional ArsR family regulator